MAIRPAKCYKRKKRSYTRISIKNPKKSYVKGVPQPTISRFESGNSKKDFPVVLHLVSEQSAQIRHNALEAARLSITKELEEMGENNFFLKILVYPHQVIRENPLATGAGADRFQTGMRKSYGKPVSMTAQVNAGQKLITLKADENNRGKIRKALKIAASKMPPKTKIVTD